VEDARVGILVRVPPDLKQALARVARDNKRSVVRECEFALERYIASAAHATTESPR